MSQMPFHLFFELSDPKVTRSTATCSHSLNGYIMVGCRVQLWKQIVKPKFGHFFIVFDIRRCSQTSGKQACQADKNQTNICRNKRTFYFLKRQH